MSHEATAEVRSCPKFHKGRIAHVIPVLLTMLYPGLLLIYFFWGQEAIKALMILSGNFVFLFMLTSRNTLGLTEKSMMTFMLFFLVGLGWYGAYWTDLKSYGVVLMVMSALGLSWAALEYSITKYVFELYFYLLLAVTFSLILAGTDQYEFNKVLSVGSRNVYSAMLVAFSVGYIFSRRIRGEHLSLILGLLFVVASFRLYSRTGLAISCLVFLIYIYYSRIFYKNWIFLCFFSSSILVVGLAFYGDGLWRALQNFLMENSNFSRGVDSPRFEIWKSYIDSVNVFSLFFGNDTSVNDLIADYGGNPHSAYLRMHSYFGLGAFALICVFFVSALQLLRYGGWICCSLIFVYLFRVAFDPVYFVTLMDYLFFPFLFYPLFKRYYRPF